MMTALGPTPINPPVSACWRLEGTTLSMSRDGAAFAAVPVKVARVAPDRSSWSAPAATTTAPIFPDQRHSE